MVSRLAIQARMARSCRAQRRVAVTRLVPKDRRRSMIAIAILCMLCQGFCDSSYRRQSHRGRAGQFPVPWRGRLFICGKGWSAKPAGRFAQTFAINGDDFPIRLWIGRSGWGYGKGRPGAGIKFYNGESDECGALVFGVGTLRDDAGAQEQMRTVGAFRNNKTTHPFTAESLRERRGDLSCALGKGLLPMAGDLNTLQRQQETAPAQARAFQRSLGEGHAERLQFGMTQDGAVSVVRRDTIRLQLYPHGGRWVRWTQACVSRSVGQRCPPISPNAREPTPHL